MRQIKLNRNKNLFLRLRYLSDKILKRLTNPIICSNLILAREMSLLLRLSCEVKNVFLVFFLGISVFLCSLFILWYPESAKTFIADRICTPDSLKRLKSCCLPLHMFVHTLLSGYIHLPQPVFSAYVAFSFLNSKTLAPFWTLYWRFCCIN